MVAVFGLIDYKEAIYLWKHYRPDFWMLMVTFVGTLFLGIEEGVLIGALLSLAMMIYQTTQPHVANLGKLPGVPHYRNISRFDDLEIRKEILIVRFDARLYYANVSYFLDELKQRIEHKGKELELFILDATSINGLDSTGIHALEELAAYCEIRKIEIRIVGLKGPLRDIFHRSEIFSKWGKEKFFLKTQHAVDQFDKKTIDQLKRYSLQTNEKKDNEN